jgi:hypothetical protein
MDLILWIAVGFAAGFVCGVVLMALMSQSSRPPPRRTPTFDWSSPLEQPSNFS